MIGTRPYRPEDFEAVFALIEAATQANQSWRKNPQQLRDQLAHSNELSGCTLAVNEASLLVGIIIWQRTGTDCLIEGWVYPEHCGEGVGTALLRAVDQEARRYFKSETISTRTLADIPGVESLFISQGYQIARRFYVMMTSLVGRNFDAVVPEGISIRPFAMDQAEMVLAADNEIFASHWGSQSFTVEQWQRHYTLERPHDPGLWVIAWDGQRAVGECLGHASLLGGPQDGWLAVVGVRKEWRRRGLASAVVAQGLQRLQQAGFVTAGLSVDSENPAAIGLYRKFGMEMTRTRLNFRKVLG